MKRFILFLFLLCSIHFWRYYYLPENFHKVTDLLTFLIMGISFVSLIQRDDLRFKNAIILLLFGIFCNILSAYFNNAQNPKDTFLTFGPYYFILIYFYLHEYKVSREELEWIIIIFAILYSIFYLWQVNEFPRRLFEGTMFRNRGTIRIRIEGNGFLMLAYFMLLNKYLIKRNPFHIVLALFLFVVLLKGGFRTLTAAGVLLTGVMFIKLVKYSVVNYVLIVLAVIMFIGLLQFEGNSSIVEGMVNASEKQKEQGDRYIRVMQYNFFSQEYPKNLSYYFFGGGLPGGVGDYSDQMDLLSQEYGFFWVDLGLIGFYYVVGLVALLGLVWYTLKATFLKLPPECLYLNVYFGFLLIVSFTTMEIFRPGIFGVQAIGLYLIDISRNEMLPALSEK